VWRQGNGGAWWAERTREFAGRTAINAAPRRIRILAAAPSKLVSGWVVTGLTLDVLTSVTVCGGSGAVIVAPCYVPARHTRRTLMSPKARTMFVGIPLLALGSVAATLQVTSATLSATRIVLNGEVRAIATGPNGELHVLLQSGSVLRYRDGDISAVPGTFGRQATRAMAVGPTGRLFLLQEQSAQVIEPTGIEGPTVPIPALASIAIRSDGKLFVASPTQHGVLHLISAAGQIEASFGSVASVTNDAAQNRFLSQALIVAGPGGAYFFVPTTSTVPFVKVYDAEGRVLREFAVEGESVSRQASEAARALSNRSTSQCTGGYIVLTAAAVDATSGHLFVGTTQAPSAPNVYEYSPLGVKVAEYIVRAPDGEEIAFVDGLAVNRDSVYVLSNRTLYRASLRQRVSRVAINEVLARSTATTLGATVIGARRPPSAFVERPQEILMLGHPQGGGISHPAFVAVANALNSMGTTAAYAVDASPARIGIHQRYIPIGMVTV